MSVFNLKQEIPLESSEARLLVRWVRFATPKHPELRVFYRIPNEAIRTPQLSAQLKKTGAKKGMPDYCLPVPRHGYGALYIELKRTEGGIVSDSQIECHEQLKYWGNKVLTANGWEEARRYILEYIGQDYDEVRL